MRRLARSTITIFILSFFVIYVKFLKVEDQLMAFLLQDANAADAGHSKIVGDGKVTKKITKTADTSHVNGKGAISTEINQEKIEGKNDTKKNNSVDATSSNVENKKNEFSNSADIGTQKSESAKLNTDDNFDTTTSFAAKPEIKATAICQ